MRSGGQGRADGRRHARGGEQERPRLDPQEVDHVGRSGDHAAAGGERLRERRHPQVDARPRRRAARWRPRRARRARRAPCASSTISRAPWRSARSAISGSGATSPSIEKTPSTTTRIAAAVGRAPARGASPAGRAGCGGRRAASRARAARRRGSRRGRRSRRRRCRSGPRIVPIAPRLAWWPVVKTSASSVPIQPASSASSSRCRSSVPFSRREPVSAGSIAADARRARPRSRAGRRSAPGSCWSRA